MRRCYFVFLALLSISAHGQNDPYVDSLILVLQQPLEEESEIRTTLLLSDKLSRSNPLQALEYAENSVQLASKFHSDSLLNWAYLNEANIYLLMGNYPLSLQTYQRVVQAAEKTRDSSMLSVAYGNLGSIYYYQRDHENALTYYLRALKAFSSHKEGTDVRYDLRKANLLNNIGIIYDETDRFEEAGKYYNEALNLAKKLDNQHEALANILNNIGTLNVDLGNTEKAFAYYTEAMELRRKNNNQLGLARSYNNLGEYFVRYAYNFDQAESYLKQAIAKSEEIGSLQTLNSASELLFELYKGAGKYKEALAALERKMMSSDSLFNEENTRKIAQLEMQFEFDKKQTEMEAAQKEQELYFLLGASLLLLLLFIVTLLFLLQKNKTRKAQVKEANLEIEKINLKNDLAIKDKELATNIMYLLNKNELINNISEKLLEIKQGISADSQGAIQKVVLDIQSNLQPELWQEFEFRFQQVHENFYRTLNERFPELTPSERRLCAFLKLNMTTKEISALTHQNAKSIDVARTRLRKKLNLTGTDQNLVTFLEQLGQVAFDPARDERL